MTDLSLVPEAAWRGDDMGRLQPADDANNG
jgi:hypothetical protein